MHLLNWFTINQWVIYLITADIPVQRECVSGLPQYEVTKTHMPKEPDELGLRQAEVVIVLQKEEGEAVAAGLGLYVAFHSCLLKWTQTSRFA